MFRGERFNRPQNALKNLSQLDSIYVPICFYSGNHSGEWMSVAPNAWNPFFSRLNQCRACPAEWVEDQVICVEVKGRQILADEMRWIRQDETIPTMNRQVFLLERVYFPVQLLDLFCCCPVHSLV